LPVLSDDDVTTYCPTKYLAVSVAIHSNNPAPTPQHGVRYEWLRKQTPVARTRYFFIYQLRD
jgi:hypothetical protein